MVQQQLFLFRLYNVYVNLLLFAHCSNFLKYKFFNTQITLKLSNPHLYKMYSLLLKFKIPNYFGKLLLSNI